MLILLSLVLFGIAACALLLMPFLLGTEVYGLYRGSRVVTCPENYQRVPVDLDAKRAARTALVGKPSLRIADCTRWPERANCSQECMSEALRTKAYTDEEVTVKAGPIFHFPVLLASFIAWVIGAFWHSQYFFRVEWREAIGLSRWQLHELGWALTPHLLTFAAPLLFAYAVAMVLAWMPRQGPFVGATVSVLMWAAFVAALFVFTGITNLSRDLVRLELGYTLVAALVIGLTVGEVNGKLLRRQILHQGSKNPLRGRV